MNKIETQKLKIFFWTLFSRFFESEKNKKIPNFESKDQKFNDDFERENFTPFLKFAKFYE